MWAAFLTGAATKATSLIEERDKEIQDDITLKINEMYKSAQETKKKAETRAGKLREVASQLKSLGFSDDEAIAVIQSGEANAETVISLAQERAKVSPITEAERKGLLPGGVKEVPGGIQEFIRRRTTPIAPEGASLIPKEQMRGAFGLPTRAAETTAKSLLARTGMTEQELLGKLPEDELSTVQLDLSVFKTENTKTLAQRLDKARVDLFEAEQEGNVDEAKRLEKVIEGLVKAKSTGAGKEEGIKPPSRSDYRADIRNARASAIQELVVEIGSASFVPNPQTGELDYIGADPVARNRIKQAVDSRVRAYTMGFMDQNGTVPSDLADTLRGFGYSVPKNNRPFGGQPPASGDQPPAAGTPAPGRPSQPPVRGSQPTAAPVAPPPSVPVAPAAAVAPGPRPPGAPPNAKPIPRTADNKVDRTKLVVGEPYYSSTGQVRIWNGTNFQPVQ